MTKLVVLFLLDRKSLCTKISSRGRGEKEDMDVKLDMSTNCFVIEKVSGEIMFY